MQTLCVAAFGFSITQANKNKGEQGGKIANFVNCVMHHDPYGQTHAGSALHVALCLSITWSFSPCAADKR
jgi:hypothetical protein